MQSTAFILPYRDGWARYEPEYDDDDNNQVIDWVPEACPPPPAPAGYRIRNNNNFDLLAAHFWVDVRTLGDRPVVLNGTWVPHSLGKHTDIGDSFDYFRLADSMEYVGRCHVGLNFTRNAQGHRVWFVYEPSVK